MGVHIFKNRCIAAIMTAILIITLFPLAAFAEPTPNYDDIKLLLTGPFVDYGYGMPGETEPKVIDDVPRFILAPQKEGPFILYGRTYIPMRLIFQLLGYSVKWQEHNPLIEISKDGESLTVNQDKKTVQKGEQVTSIPMVLINNRYYICLRDFSRVTGDDIYWENDTRTVIYKMKDAKGVLPPVRIVDLRYKESEEYHGVGIGDTMYEETVKGNELSFAVKNTSGNTIPSRSLIRYSDLWNLGENNKPSFHGVSTMRSYEFYRGQDLEPGETTGQVKYKPFIGYGNYEIFIFGIAGKDEYVGKVRAMTPPPDTAGWE